GEIEAARHKALVRAKITVALKPTTFHEIEKRCLDEYSPLRTERMKKAIRLEFARKGVVCANRPANATVSGIQRQVEQICTDHNQNVWRLPWFDHRQRQADELVELVLGGEQGPEILRGIEVLEDKFEAQIKA